MGAILVNFISKTKLDKPTKEQSPKLIKFENVPAPWFVDQWIASHSAPENETASQKEIIPLLIFVIVAVIAYLFLILS